jgi:hypothetical protein
VNLLLKRRKENVDRVGLLTVRALTAAMDTMLATAETRVKVVTVVVEKA